MAPGDLGSGHHSSDARLDLVVGQDLVPWPNNNDNEFDTGIGGMTANHSFSTAGSLNCSMAQHLVPSITPVNISFKKALQERDLLLNHFPHVGVTELGLSATKERT